MCGHGSRHGGRCLCPSCFNEDPDEAREIGSMPETPPPGGVGADAPTSGLPLELTSVRCGNLDARLLMLSSRPALGLEAGQALPPSGIASHLGTEFIVSFEAGGQGVALRQIIVSEEKEVLKELRAAWEDAEKTPRADDVRTLPCGGTGPRGFEILQGPSG